jgi:outer membrane protein assembly factor BamB
MFSGSILWKKSAFPAGCGPSVTPVAADSLVVVGNQAFASATGNRAWEAEVRPATPAVAAGRVLYGEAAVELVTGQVLWRWPEGESSLLTPTVGGGFVYASGRDRRLYTLAADTGQVAWQQELPEPAGASPALTPGLIVVPLVNGGVLAFKNS